MFFKTIKLLWKSWPNFLRDDTFVYFSLICGFHFDYKNKLMSLISRIFCILYLAGIVLNFLDVYLHRDILSLLLISHILIMNIVVLMFSIIFYYGKQVFLSNYLNSAKVIFLTMGSPSSHASISVNVILIFFAVGIRYILAYTLISKYKYVPTTFSSIFGTIALYSSIYYLSITISFIYEILWKQFKTLRKLLQDKLHQQYNIEDKTKHIMKFIHVYKNIIQNMKRVNNKMQFQVSNRFCR